MQTEEIYRMLIPVLAPFLVAVLKHQARRLPKRALPWAALVAGLALEVLRAYLTDSSADPAIGGVLGLAGVGVREVVDQTTKKKI